MHARMCVCVRACMCACVRACMCVCTFMCVSTYVHLHVLLKIKVQSLAGNASNPLKAHCDSLEISATKPPRQARSPKPQSVTNTAVKGAKEINNTNMTKPGQNRAALKGIHKFRDGCQNQSPGKTFGGNLVTRQQAMFCLRCQNPLLIKKQPDRIHVHVNVHLKSCFQTSRSGRILF